MRTNWSVKKIGKGYFKEPIFSLKSFQALREGVPCQICAFWNVKSSLEKLTQVNTTLRFLILLDQNYGAKIHANNTINFEPLKRKLWDRNGRYIVGYGMKSLVNFKVSNNSYKLFFNGSIFVDVETTFTELFPSATITVSEVSDKLTWTRTPLSRNGDVTATDFNSEKALFIETTTGYLNRRLRKYFKGWKHVGTRNKYLIYVNKMSVTDREFIKNNGFTYYGPVSNGSEIDVVLSKIIDVYFHHKLKQDL